MRHLLWVHPEQLIRYEFAQSADEGADIAHLIDRWRAAGYSTEPLGSEALLRPRDPAEAALARDFLTELAELPRGSSDHEPSDWPTIRALIERHPAGRSAAVRQPPSGQRPGQPSADRILGGWIGRAVGCVLGKPVEGLPRAGITEIRHATGREPLRSYFTAVGLDPEVARRWPWNPQAAPVSLLETLSETPEDDDLNYTLIALRVLEQYGGGFTSGDVARCWLHDMPVLRSHTAERIAYRNLLLGLEPPDTATAGNPYREWIGAQIRADLYGWVNSGDPARAAEWAWRDASLSHTRNGLYGAMFVAAMAATAVTGADIERVLDAGTGVIPPGSRLAEAVAFGRELGCGGLEPDAAYTALDDRYGRLSWVHVLGNAALVAYALTASGGHFDTAIGLVVSGGWDTDSNGATVGAITGAMAGRDGIGADWTEPLRGRVTTSLAGFDQVSFDELALRTITVAGRCAERP